MSGNTSAPLRFSAMAAHRRRSLVSLTPLIDVVFILLLFFMLASSFSNLHTMGLNMPASPGNAAAGMQGVLLIEIRAHSVRYAGRTISLDRLVERVRAQLQRHPGRRVLVRPAKGVSLQRAVTVLDRLSAAGARNLSLIGGSP